MTMIVKSFIMDCIILQQDSNQRKMVFFFISHTCKYGREYTHDTYISPARIYIRPYSQSVIPGAEEFLKVGWLQAIVAFEFRGR